MSMQPANSPVTQPRPQSPGHVNHNIVDNTPGKRKRAQQPSACVPCRSRKSKCDGNRLQPCSSCTRRKTHCTYELGIGETRVSKLKRENNNLMDQLSGYQAVINLIRSSTDEEAIELVKRIRHSTTADEAMDFIRAAASLMNPEQTDKPSPVENQHSDKPSPERMIIDFEAPPVSLLTEGNLLQQQRLQQQQQRQREQPRPISFVITHRPLLPKQAYHEEPQTSPVSGSPSSIATHDLTVKSPPIYYTLPKLPQPTPYGGLPYTAHKDTCAARPAQPIEPDIAPRHFPPLSTSSYRGAPILPPLAGLDQRGHTTPRTAGTSPPARGSKPFHVWPQDTLPKYPSHPPL